MTTKLLAAAAAGLLSLGLLTACGPSDSSPDPAVSSAAPAAPASSAATAAAPVASNAPAADPSCNPASQGAHRLKPVPNHKVIYPDKHRDHSTLQAQDAKFVCDATGGHYEGTGPVKSYTLSKDIQVYLSAGPGSEDVDGGKGYDGTANSFDLLMLRVYDCMGGAKFCAKYNAWEIGQDADGKINYLKQINP
ncbi:hypothetical protein [Kitasatospora cathayae]|uniref:Lipoprotein n=1 Tax=Kitasatospora cathayae TaxID=3004092 RepID=A0ABY7Q7A0_9ACTN|nr:hypothetical protein [Kitasatospora sp. HUAS 3-15]WBP88550.1 hypothetical protein O1G21_23690 [Kitasatospora sp. HUAS 3-15]